MENYIHPAAIARVTGAAIDVTDENDIVTLLCGALGKKKTEVKAILSDEVAPTMTVEEIDERDPNGEIRGWLRQIADLDEAPLVEGS